MASHHGKRRSEIMADEMQDMWNEKDYSHTGLGKVMKTLNGDHLTKITQPPETL